MCTSRATWGLLDLDVDEEDIDAALANMMEPRTGQQPEPVVSQDPAPSSEEGSDSSGTDAGNPDLEAFKWVHTATKRGNCTRGRPRL